PIHPRVGPAVRPDVPIRADLLFLLKNFRFSAVDLQEDLHRVFRAAMAARLAERRYPQALGFEKVPTQGLAALLRAPSPRTAHQLGAFFPVCWAIAAAGQATSAPPRSVMKSRRFMVILPSR